MRFPPPLGTHGGAPFSITRACAILALTRPSSFISIHMHGSISAEDAIAMLTISKIQCSLRKRTGFFASTCIHAFPISPTTCGASPPQIRWMDTPGGAVLRPSAQLMGRWFRQRPPALCHFFRAKRCLFSTPCVVGMAKNCGGATPFRTPSIRLRIGTTQKSSGSIRESAWSWRKIFVLDSSGKHS